MSEGEPKSTRTSRIARWFVPPPLTKVRIAFAFAVAAVVDALQIWLGPLGWVVIDQALDVLAMVLTTAALGFHMLLLPTFILEFLPVTDWLPTWTGCVGAVVMLRKGFKSQTPVPPTIIETSPVPPKILAPITAPQQGAEDHSPK